MWVVDFSTSTGPLCPVTYIFMKGLHKYYILIEPLSCHLETFCASCNFLQMVTLRITRCMLHCFPSIVALRGEVLKPRAAWSTVSPLLISQSYHCSEILASDSKLCILSQASGSRGWGCEQGRMPGDHHRHDQPSHRHHNSHKVSHAASILEVIFIAKWIEFMKSVVKLVIIWWVIKFMCDEKSLLKQCAVHSISVLMTHAFVTMLQRSHGEKSHKSHHHSHSRSRSRKRREAEEREREEEHREHREHRREKRRDRDHQDGEPERGTWHGRQRHPSRRARETALRKDTCQSWWWWSGDDDHYLNIPCNIAQWGKVLAIF